MSRNQSAILQSRTMDNLVVNGEFASIVIDDQDTDASTAIGKGFIEPGPEIALVDDGQALFDITRLGHGDNITILANIENAILLEDRAEHVLHNDGGRGIGDEARFFVQLLGKEIHAEITVLSSLRRGGDADHLARAALKNKQVTNTDVMTGDGDGIGRAAGP